METSITQIAVNLASRLQEIFCENLRGGNFTQFCSEMFESVKMTALETATLFLSETDKLVRQESERKERYTVERNNQARTLQTEFGQLGISRTIYTEKATGKCHALLDEVLQIDKYERIENNLKAKVISLACDTSYGKAGKVAGGVLSRQTVMNVVHRLQEIAVELPKLRPAQEIFIEADEDHIHMQDGKSRIVKLVYVHEGTKEVCKGRKELVNARYFTSMSKENDDIWLDVYRYVDEAYGSDRSKITIRGDGAQWITGGLEYFQTAKFELDSFHMFKAITRATGHCKKLRHEIIDGIKTKDCDRVESLFDEVIGSSPSNSSKKTASDTKTYILNFFDEIATFNGGGGCSAEGHVSHILSARLSSRPMGWSLKGANNIAALRAFVFNGGKTINLTKRPKPQTITAFEKVKTLKPDKFAVHLDNIPILKAGSKHGMKHLVKSLIS